jgi:hypothetical protein
MAQIYAVTLYFLRAGLGFLVGYDRVSAAVDAQRRRVERFKVMEHM